MRTKPFTRELISFLKLLTGFKRTCKTFYWIFFTTYDRIMIGWVMSIADVILNRNGSCCFCSYSFLSSCFTVATRVWAIRTYTVNLLTCFKFIILLDVCQYIFLIFLKCPSTVNLTKIKCYIELYQV